MRQSARFVRVFTGFIVALMALSARSGAVGVEDRFVLQATETQVTTAAADQFDPAIAGSLVVYTDFSGVDADVWYTDLTTGQAFPVSRAAGDQQLTGVSGGRIVYTDWNAMDVLVFDVATRQTVNLTNAAGSNALDPAIGGSLVAWTDDRDQNAEIYASDLATGEERRITNDPLVDQSPAVGDGIVAWERCDGYACDVLVYEWTTGLTRQLTATSHASERFPDVYGRTVVFQREQGTPIDKDVVAINLDRPGEQVLALAGDQENAHISGEYVSFNDSSSGVPHIGLWELLTGEHFEVSTGASGQYLDDIDGKRIVYSDNRAGTLDVWMAEFQILSVPPSIRVNPESVNFGEVETGKSRVLLVTVSNTGSADLSLDAPVLTPDSSPAFSVTQVPPSPVAPGASADIAVAFTPIVAGAAEGALQVISDDPVHGFLRIPLAGTGVLAAEAPAQQIEAILLFFDSSVAGGSLLGSGPGKSADNRLKALRNMLRAAGELIRRGDTAGAHQQLADAYLKTDGQPQPPDFVTGPAAAELSQMIQKLLASL